MNTKNYCRPILILTIIVSLLSVLWLYLTLGRTIYSLSEDITIPLHYNSFNQVIVLLYAILPISMITIQIVFFIKQLQSIRNGILFSPTCYKLIFCWGIIWIFYDFCAANIANAIYFNNINQIVIDGTIIGIPAIAFTFAFLYKTATDIAEENNLTI